MLKVLLINPPSGAYIRDDRCQVPVRGLTSSLRMPLDLAYMATGFLKYDWQVKIGDYQAYANGLARFEKDLKEFQPDYLIVSVTTPTLLNDMAICQQARQLRPDLKIVVKGAHITAKAEEVLTEFSVLDVAIVNEYEKVTRKLAQGLPLPQIPGIVYREDGQIIVNPPAKLTLDLDELGIPARQLIDNALYTRPDTGELQTSILTSRGCRNRCSFCLVSFLSGSHVASRTSGSVIQEIEQCLGQFKISNFYFRADTFTWDREWVIELCEKIIKLKLAIQWVCNSRVDTIDLELAQIMKQAGCWMIGFGIESGQQQILNQVAKNINSEQIEKAVQACKQAGLKTYLFYILNLPGENLNSLEQTLKLNQKLRPDFAEFHLAYPFPGTKLYDMVIREGLIDDQELYNTDVFNFYLPNPNLTIDQLKSFRRKAIMQMYLNPSYIYNSLKQVKSFQQLKNYSKKGWDIITNL